MIAIFVAVLLLFAANSVAADAAPPAIVPGKLQEDVINELGEPAGKMRNGKRTIWLYQKGTVEFENDRVIRVNWMSDDAYIKEQARRAHLAEAKRLAEAARSTNQPVIAGKPEPHSAPSLETITARYVRPFIRPVYENVQYYNNIPIVFELSKWPPAMRQAYDVSVEIPVETGQRATTYQTLPYELKKYPDEMLEQTLRCIYMIRDIRGDGKKMNPAALAFYTEGIVLEHTYHLHHEYAHELHFLFYDLFPSKEITAVSGGYRGFEERKSVYYKELWQLGYVSDYAMSNVAEDFAEFCSKLYLQPVVLFTAMKENPKLQEKFIVIRPFLEMVKRRTTGDTTPMDEAYFSKFDRLVWKP
ncbi:MAG: putative zinc-binding metallopeptidase [Kiritimatiellae bacterium]|nr:putative zinc-binding metallopeptidase [Kiritimatiellia bacterium]MDD5522727.1 putative zinc-binding metallopeptidase [Kiritimatiellia bacterium]